MIRRNVKGVEVLGLLLALVAWGMNWNSVEYWSAAQAEHERAIDRIIQAYHNVQITANVSLESAIDRGDASTSKEGTGASVQPYQRAWHAPDVRRAWLQRSVNDITGLNLLLSTLSTTNQKYDLALDNQISELRKTFYLSINVSKLS
ncbi:MAG TPA: hypothetical protein VN310_01745 [Candidatus Dormibacteraeota bacterium]|jgi:hypothetical protein|nr:hypothetical protein [Candidatus Dormibacteraeota bacterium]